MKNTIYIVPIEPIDQRYTKQWYENIPLLLKNSKYNIVTIDGLSIVEELTSGSFLNFSATNIYKSSQLTKISELFNKKIIKDGDKFLFTDAWNPSILSLKYMSELLNINIEIHSIWHAGSYDKTDILGIKMSKDWSYEFEKSIYFASDYNYFSTKFHMEMFLNNLKIYNHKKAILSGQPHDFIIESLEKNFNNEKQDIVIWPHRYNYDKQPIIAEDLKLYFDVLITQKQNLSKKDYYSLLGKSKVIFSCSLHENLGISMMEGTLSGAIPIVPDRVSYSEMYLKEFKYPSKWTENLSSFDNFRDNVDDFIRDKIDNYDKYKEKLKEQNNILKNKYLTANTMISLLLK